MEKYENFPDLQIALFMKAARLILFFSLLSSCERGYHKSENASSADTKQHRRADKGEYGNKVKIVTPDNPFGVAKPDAIAYTQEKRKELLRKVAELKRPLGMKDLDSIEGILINAIEEDHVFVEQLLASLEDEIALKVVGKYSDRLTWYISSKPQEMRELINSTVWTNSNSAAVAGISKQLFNLDPKGTISWISSSEMTPFLRNLCKEMFHDAILKKVPEGSIEAALGTLEGTPYKLAALTGAIRGWGLLQNEKAEAILSTLSESDRNRVFPEYITPLAVHETDLAWSIILRDSDKYTPEVVSNATQTVGVIYASKDLKGALDWYSQISDENQQAGAVAGIVKFWSSSDILGASEWLATLPSGPVRDAGAKIIVNKIQNTDPQMAEQWRKSLTPQGPGNN